MTQVDNPAIDLQGVASQDQAMEAMRQVEQEVEERAKRARLPNRETERCSEQHTRKDVGTAFCCSITPPW